MRSWCLILTMGVAAVAVAQEREFVFEPLASHPRCHAVTVAETADGGLAAAWFAGEREGTPDQAIFWSRKGAKGGWSAPRVLVDTPNVADFNPVLLEDGRRLHLFFVRAATGTDPNSSLWHTVEGDPWSEPARVLGNAGYWGRNAPVKMGRSWVIPVSDVQAKGARVLLSEDLARFRLSTLMKADKHLSQPAVARLDEKHLVAALRQRGRPGGRVWLARSEDGGESWSEPERSPFPNPDSGIALLGLPGGKLLLVYNDSDTRRTPLVTAVSGDGGRTWRPGPVLEREEGEYSYPTALVGRDGRVHIFYTWKRTHILHVSAPPVWFQRAGGGSTVLP